LVEPHDPRDLADVARARVVAGEQAQALAHGQDRVEGRGLEHDADAFAPRAAGALRILAEHLHVAAVARAVALEDLDGRRLAGAVRAEQAEHLAGTDLEVDPAHRLVLAVALAQTAHAHCCGHSSTSANAPVLNCRSSPVSAL